jgi:hypothetical protein
MIINSVIPGQRQRVASLATYPEGTSKYVVADEGSTVELDFLYSNTSSFAGKAIYYADGVEEDTQDLAANDDYSWDVTSLLTDPGLYSFKIVAVDTNGNGTKLEFTVFYGFSLEDFTFSYNSGLSGYVLVAYSGNSADVVIPAVFDDGTNGERNVVRIGNGAFLDNDTMETVVVPDTVQSIGATAFFSCSVLESFEIDRNTPPTLEANNVLDAYSPLLPLKIYVPSASVATYKAAANWIEYQNAIFAIS